MVAPVVKYTEPKRLSDLVLMEEELEYSRGDDGVVLSTTVAEIGTIIALDGDDKLVPLPSDGALVAVAVAIRPRAATAADASGDLLRIERHAILKDSGLAWPVGISGESKAKALGELKALGILVRRAV